MDKVLLQNLYLINSKSGMEEEMADFILAYVESRASLPNAPICKIQTDVKGNILITSGKADKYPCLCAHMDEVHTSPHDKIVMVYQNFMFGFSPSRKSFVGIGADDKNGIYIALKALDELPAVKLLFTVEEETGGGGAYAVNIKKWLNDVRYVIQCDRRGKSDFITSISGTKLVSKEFKKDAGAILKQYGFKETYGMFTDVGVLKTEGLKVSCCNISCGYYGPHTDSEITDLNDLENTFQAVMDVCKTLTKEYPHSYQKPVHKGFATSQIQDWDEWNRKWGYGTSPLTTSKGIKKTSPHPEKEPCRDCLQLNCDLCRWSVPYTPKGAAGTNDLNYRSFNDHDGIYD